MNLATNNSLKPLILTKKKKLATKGLKDTRIQMSFLKGNLQINKFEQINKLVQINKFEQIN